MLGVLKSAVLLGDISSFVEKMEDRLTGFVELSAVVSGSCGPPPQPQPSWRCKAPRGGGGVIIILPNRLLIRLFSTIGPDQVVTTDAKALTQQNNESPAESYENRRPWADDVATRIHFRFHCGSVRLHQQAHANTTDQLPDWIARLNLTDRSP
jgi:hypothetical protein